MIFEKEARHFLLIIHSHPQVNCGYVIIMKCGKDVEMMYYACEEHIELALDIVVDETENPPIVDKIEQQQKQSTTCSFCKNEPVYTVE